MENKKSAPVCETGAAERIARISADLAFNRREMLAESKRKLQELLQAEHPFGQGRMVTVSFPQHICPSDSTFIKYCVSSMID